MEAAKEAAEYTVTSKPDWFTASENALMELRTIRKEALKILMEKGTDESQETLKEAR